MHYRGKAFELFAENGNETTTLLRVPQYDFNWQHSYEFIEPLPLDDIDRLHFTATFDNSSGNPFNPDPTEWVTWGDQTWEEMAVAFFEVSEPLEQPEAETVATTDSEAGDERQRKIDAYVERVFKRLDANKDGTITESESPIVIRRFSRHDFDRDGDGETTRDEVRQLAESIYR